VVRPVEHATVLPYARLLVATDLSAESRRPFAVAALVARAAGASVRALHVPQGAGPTPDAPAVARFLEPEFAGVPVEGEIAPGRPWDVLVRAARTHRADLVVLATTGRDSLGERILGSTTDRVLRHAPCGVLVA
jgi:nucleotide-binding universal stress UspA family protein